MKKETPLMPGSIVLSRAGRDQGRWFVVMALPEEEYALIADGELRKVEKPKRKKRKHLQVTQELNSSLQQKLVDGTPVSNKEIRACLTAVKPHEEG